MALAYLTDPNLQFVTRSGVPNVGGFILVFLNGTDDNAVTYKNWDGTLNEERIVLDSNGRAVIIADDSRTYRIEVYSSGGRLLWTSEAVEALKNFSNDFTDADKEKLDGIEEGAQRNVQADWDAASGEPGFIENKPDLDVYAKKDEVFDADVDGVSPVHVEETIEGQQKKFDVSIEEHGIGRDLLKNWWSLVPDQHFFSVLKLEPYVVLQLKREFLDLLQYKLTAGTNISIDAQNVISATFSQEQANWAQTDVDAPDYIKGKPDVVKYERWNAVNSTYVGSQQYRMFDSQMILDVTFSQGSGSFSSVSFMMRRKDPIIGTVVTWECFVERNQENSGSVVYNGQHYSGDDYNTTLTDAALDDSGDFANVEIDVWYYGGGSGQPQELMRHGKVFIRRSMNMVMVSTEYEE